MTWPDDFIDKVICGDCNKILPLIPDDGIDGVITDPPYGINLDADYAKRHGNKPSSDFGHAAVVGDDKPFNPSHLLRFMDKVMFLFGGNNYSHQLPMQRNWICWDKTGGHPEKSSPRRGQMELIWSNVLTRPLVFPCVWQGYFRTGEEPTYLHPTQKPLMLMRWLITNWTKPGDIIFDPYAGSGTTLVACKELDRRYIGIEISPAYCKIAEDRLAQEELFNPKRTGTTG